MWNIIYDIFWSKCGYEHTSIVLGAGRAAYLVGISYLLNQPDLALIRFTSVFY